MQTKNIIKNQANVIKITSLTKGNVIKIIEKEYGDTYKNSYGVVLDLLNSGTKTFIQILKYKVSYSDLNADIVMFSGSDDLTIFPATIEEVQSHFADVVKSMKRKIEEEKEELQKKVEALEKANAFVSGQLSKSLSEPEFSEMTQEDFNQKKQELLGE
mgnify:CR=1 FL=1